MSIEQERHEKMQTKEIKETRIWGASMLIFLVMQTATAIWWASSINAQVAQNQKDIEAVKGDTVLFLDRQQVEDILGARDTRLESIEQSLVRIERRLNNY